MIALTLAAVAALCTPVEGERILARDMARAWPEFASVPGETALGYAPVPGVRRMLPPAELARLGARYGVVGPAPAVCFEVLAAPLSREKAEAAMRASLDIPDARIEIVELSRYPVPDGDVVFPREALRAPAGSASLDAPVLWRGAVRRGARRLAVWARVIVRAPVVRVCAGMELRAGQIVSAAQLREERREGFPGRKAMAVAEVLGRRVRRTIPAGGEVRPEMLHERHDVETGDNVEVRVTSGGARLAFTGRAESAGGNGQTVRVRNPESRRAFSARVAGRGVVAVEAGEEKR